MADETRTLKSWTVTPEGNVTAHILVQAGTLSTLRDVELGSCDPDYDSVQAALDGKSQDEAKDAGVTIEVAAKMDRNIQPMPPVMVQP